MRAVVYNTETGKIVRYIEGEVDADRHITDPNTELLTEEDVEIPRNSEVMMVDTELMEIVEDPDYIERDTLGDIKQEIESGEVSTDEALERLIEVL